LGGQNAICLKSKAELPFNGGLAFLFGEEASVMKSILFRLLVGLFVFGLLIAFMQYQIFAGEVPDDFDDIKKLAEMGDIDAQFELGLMYRYGEGVPQDYKQAVYWYTKAAEQGYVSGLLLF
jgi:TPR repeat protein